MSGSTVSEGAPRERATPGAVQVSLFRPRLFAASVALMLAGMTLPIIREDGSSYPQASCSTSLKAH